MDPLVPETVIVKTPCDFTVTLRDEYSIPPGRMAALVDVRVAVTPVGTVRPSPTVPEKGASEASVIRNCTDVPIFTCVNSPWALETMLKSGTYTVTIAECDRIPLVPVMFTV